MLGSHRHMCVCNSTTGVCISFLSPGNMCLSKGLFSCNVSAMLCTCSFEFVWLSPAVLESSAMSATQKQIADIDSNFRNVYAFRHW